MSRHLLALCAAGALALATGPARAQIEGIPRYEHIILIIAENHGYDQIIDKEVAPNINKLAIRSASMTMTPTTAAPARLANIAARPPASTLTSIIR
jgi:hypothetical protein